MAFPFDLRCESVTCIYIYIYINAPYQSLCVYVLCVYVRACMRTHACVCVHMLLCSCVYTCLCVSVCASVCVRALVNIQTSVYFIIIWILKEATNYSFAV